MSRPVDQARSDPPWQPSAPDRIEADLADLWSSVARTGPVSRALMSNLIVVAECPESASDITILCSEAPIVELAERHPARIVLLGYTPGIEECSAPKTTHVAVCVFGPTSARYGVELVAVHAACADRSIPSIVRGLVVGSVPTAVWWTSDLSEGTLGSASPAPAIIAMGRQFIYDSASWHDVAGGARTVAKLVDGPHTIDIADLNWRRLSSLRHAIVHAVRTLKITRRLEPADVSIRYRPDCGMRAWLLAGWLGSRLKWNALGLLEESDDIDDDLVVVLGQGEQRITATMKKESIEVRPESGQPPFSVSVPDETEADAIASELRALSYDAPLREALRTLAVMR